MSSPALERKVVQAFVPSWSDVPTPHTNVDAYTYARRAQYSSNLGEARDYARRARNSAADAVDNAQACRCDQAASTLDDAERYACRVYNASELSEVQDYARRAKNEADDALTELRECADKKRPR